MNKFAFVVHPLHPRDLAKKYPFVNALPDSMINAMLARMKPKLMSHVTGITSLTGETTEGWFIGCPLTPTQMLSMPVEEVYKRIVDCTNMAADLGAQIIGLGAFTAVVGDGGITVAKRSKIPVTSGNSYTVATAIEGLLKACEMVGVPVSESNLAVVGATGSIGKTCAQILGKQFKNTVLVGRDLERTLAVANTIPGAKASTDVSAIQHADAVVTVTSADAEIIHPKHLKPGCVVCDVARPRDVSKLVQKDRPDVLVIEGGVVKVPGPVDFGLNFGFPPGTAYACMSETIMLALEGRLESYTLGKDVSEQQVEETWVMAKKHGFTLDGFRSFEKAVQPEAIERARIARGRADNEVPPATAAIP